VGMVMIMFLLRLILFFRIIDHAESSGTGCGGGVICSSFVSGGRRSSGRRNYPLATALFLTLSNAKPSRHLSIRIMLFFSRRISCKKKRLNQRSVTLKSLFPFWEGSAIVDFVAMH